MLLKPPTWKRLIHVVDGHRLSLSSLTQASSTPKKCLQSKMHPGAWPLLWHQDPARYVSSSKLHNSLKEGFLQDIFSCLVTLGFWKTASQKAQGKSKVGELTRHTFKNTTIQNRNTILLGTLCGSWDIGLVRGGLVPRLSTEDGVCLAIALEKQK